MRQLKWPVLSAVLMAGIWHGTAEAQIRPWEVSIAGGPSIPQGDFAEEAGTGYHVQGSVGMNVPLLPFGVRADVLWQELQDEESEWFRQIGGALNATFAIPVPVIEPYALAGVSYMRTEAPDELHVGHTHAGDGENLLGVHAGAGVEFPFMGLRGFIEGRYLNLLGGDDAKRFQSIPVTVGIRF